jgi:signal transduction histidine kinase
MAPSNRSVALRGPPLLLQILLLLLGGLVVAQAVTLALTLILPPAPARQHELDAVAAALRGQPIGEDRPDRLVRKLQNDPPDLSGPSWLVSDHSQRELASLLNTDVANVRLAFYTPLPFAGTVAPRPVRTTRGADRSPYLQFASYDPSQAGSRPGAPPQPGTGNGGGYGNGPGTVGGFSSGTPGIGGSYGPSSGSFARPSAGAAAPWAVEQPSRNSLFGPSGTERSSDMTAGPTLPAAPEKQELVGPPATSRPDTVEAAPSPVIKPRTAAPTRGVAPSPPVPADRKAAPVAPVRTPQRGLFGLAPAPFVEGDFVAAWRMPNGQWSVVQPAPEPFPNSWQRRVLVWFAASFALTAPFGWLFARRIVKPLSGFVEAAELLGRDPSAVVRGLDGPAEVGRAARAFNRMQARLKSFVDDRTAMVGAISHDLRTPLTRLRFRIEDVESEAMRDGMIGEVEEMEQMITSVLAFIRDASTPGVRERLDLRTILDEVVRNVTLIGGDAAVETAQPAPVEVDILGIRRLLTNLVENAVKYGERARIRLRIDQDCAVAEVADDGPGVPEDELERVFEPFYRATNATGKQGNGLGLAVCRSIARAHGGDVRLLRSDRGFVAQLRIPLYDTA